jgi:hypothetical protein
MSHAHRALGKYLSPYQIEGLLKRRDAILALEKQLVAEKGLAQCSIDDQKEATCDIETHAPLRPLCLKSLRLIDRTLLSHVTN